MTGSGGANPIPDWASVELSTLTLVIAWRSSSGALEARRVALTTSVADELRTVCRDVIHRIQGLELREWTPEAPTEKEEYLRASESQLGDDSQILGALKRTEFEPISAENLPSVSILFYALIVGPPERRVAFVRKYNPQRAVGHRIVTFFANRLEKLEQPLFIFDYHADMVFDPRSGLSILALGAFNLLFKTSPEMLEKLSEDVEKIASALPMTPESMRLISSRATTDTRVRRRLESIVGRGHLAVVTIDVLRAEIERQGYDPSVYIRGGKLDFSQGDVPEILKVLNEDLFVGGLSGESFEVARKSSRAR